MAGGWGARLARSSLCPSCSARPRSRPAAGDVFQDFRRSQPPGFPTAASRAKWLDEQGREDPFRGVREGQSPTRERLATAEPPGALRPRDRQRLPPPCPLAHSPRLCPGPAGARPLGSPAPLCAAGLLEGRVYSGVNSQG